LSAEENIPAARLKDPMTHSGALVGNHIGASIGMAAGIVGGLLTAPVLGPVAIAAVIVLANDGAQLGAFIGGWIGESLAPAVPMGEISSAAASVFVGAEKRKQARIEDDVSCSGGLVEGIAAASMLPLSGGLGLAAVAIQELSGGGHGGARIAQGCLTIFVEKRSAARKACKTTCGGTISDGEKSVLLGKGLGALPGYEQDIWETPGLNYGLAGLDWVGTGAAVVGAFMVGAPIGIAAALIAAGFKVAEAATGGKPWGYGDDFGGIIGSLLKAGSRAIRHRGSLVKLYIVGRSLLGDVLGDGVGLAKGGKRTVEYWNEPQPLPTIGKTRP
jgi:hypothetical protein